MGEPTRDITSQDPAALIAEATEWRGCAHDMGFDRELGPLGCSLDRDGAEGCVCAGYVPMILRLATALRASNDALTAAQGRVAWGTPDERAELADLIAKVRDREQFIMQGASYSLRISQRLALVIESVLGLPTPPQPDHAIADQERVEVSGFVVHLDEPPRIIAQIGDRPTFRKLIDGANNAELICDMDTREAVGLCIYLAPPQPDLPPAAQDEGGQP